MRFAIITLLLITFTGCAHHYPLLSNEQRLLIESENKYLFDNREIIYDAIQRSSELGALLILPKDYSSKLKIFPGKSPVDILVSNQEAFEVLKNESTEICLFVFSQTTNTEPIRAPCQIFISEALTILELKSQYENLVATLNVIEKRVKTENEAFAAALAPTMSLTEFNAIQTDTLDKQMKTVTGALAASSEAQSQANNLLKDVIEKFAQTYAGLQGQLEEISKRLETIK
jgi:hypothetical protein